LTFKMSSLQVGHGSDVGQVRGTNEDAYLALVSIFRQGTENLPFGLFMGADGMGGQDGGEEASQLAIRTASESLIDRLYLPLLGRRGLDSSQTPITEVLAGSVADANAAINRDVPGGGTTLSIAVVLREIVYVAHVGDSRVYMMRYGVVEQVSRDHSVVARLIEMNEASPEELLTHPQRSLLYRAVGQEDEVPVDLYHRSLMGDCHLLICSDGLWSLVSEDEISDIVRSEPEPQRACDQLIEKANARGGDDNITVVLAEVEAT
jgi:serine/threonine protein phosphatase PrpC